MAGFKHSKETYNMDKVGAAMRKANKLSVFEKNALNVELAKEVPGGPTAGKVLISIKEDEIAKKTSQLLETNTNVHQIIVSYECNDPRMIAGAWVQMQKNSAMEELEWADKTQMLVREHQVVWVFDRDPRKAALDKAAEMFENDTKDEHSAKEDILLPSPGKGA